VQYTAATGIPLLAHSNTLQQLFQLLTLQKRAAHASSGADKSTETSNTVHIVWSDTVIQATTVHQHKYACSWPSSHEDKSAAVQLKSVPAAALDYVVHVAVMQQHGAPAGLIQPTKPLKRHTLSQRHAVSTMQAHRGCLQRLLHIQPRTDQAGATVLHTGLQGKAQAVARTAGFSVEPATAW